MRVDKVLSIYKSELESEGLNGMVMSVRLGLSYGSYKSSTKPSSKKVPRWVLAYLSGRGYRVEGGRLVHEKKKSTATQYLCVKCGLEE